MRQFGIIFSVVLIGIALQLYLSNRENRYLGLIIPTLHFIASLFVALFLTDILSAFLGFVVASTPTVINYLIYRRARNKIEKNTTNAINKMKIDDL